MLAPGSSVVKTDTFTSVIKEPGKRDVTIRNSDLVTKAERRIEIQLYANRRPKTPTGKITEDLISHHAKETRKKIRRRQTNETPKNSRRYQYGLLVTFKCNLSSSSTNAHKTKMNSYNSAAKVTSRSNK